MRNALFALTIATATVYPSAQALAQALDMGDAAASPAFGIPPLGDSVLAGIHGTGVAGFGRESARRVADQYSLGFIQFTGQTSRISMDNWWTQPGAALIDSNLIAERIAR